MRVEVYTNGPSAVKPERTAFTDPWQLLSELTSEAEASAWLSPSAEVVEHFFSLVARRRDQRERDVLIPKGLTIFWYRLADALARVDHHLLERMARIAPRGAS